MQEGREINGVLGEGITQLNFDENRRKGGGRGEQVEAGKACERERGKKDNISFKKKKKKGNGRNVEKYVEDWMSV